MITTTNAMNLQQLKKWPFPEQEFLGRGAFGNVMRGLYCGAPVAVKELLTGKDHMSEVRRQAKEELLKEIGILMEFRVRLEIHRDGHVQRKCQKTEIDG